MNLNALQNIIKEYLQKRRDGMDYSEIRKELHEKQYEYSDIKKIVQQIDDTILEEEFEKSKNKTSKIMRTGGWVLLIIGTIFTLGTNLNIFHIQNNLLTYGFLLIGIIMLFYGFIKSKRQNYY